MNRFSLMYDIGFIDNFQVVNLVSGDDLCLGPSSVSLPPC